MASQKLYKADRGVLVESEDVQGASPINWAAEDNNQIAHAMCVDVRSVARLRPAEFCTDVEDFRGFVGVEGRKVPDIKPKAAKKKASKE